MTSDGRWLPFLVALARRATRAVAAAIPEGPRWALLVAAWVLCATAPARAAELPVACGAAACAGGPNVWVTSGQATSSVTGTQLNIRQTTDKAILNWAEFNVGAGHSVNFQQPGTDSLAVNKIYQSSPSQIFGNLTANGQVYLINRNGILFGEGSQVNVRGLVASSLDLASEAESGGILSPQLLPFGKAAFEGDGRVYVLDENGQVVTDANGDPVPVRVAVEQGAKITAGKGGRVALLGQEVDNAGEIESPDGQAILAAGQKVYLQASSDPELRGLLVEVDAGGTVWNRVTGAVSSDRGNVSLVGLAVNQDGRVSATTSVRANGSIRLLARDTVSVVNSGSAVTVSTSNAGEVRLGGGSRTEVLPDPDDTEVAVDEQAQAPSIVEVMGRSITLESGSSIRVPGGNVSLAALPNPALAVPTTEPLPADPGSAIRVEAGASIDVSGSVAEVSVTRNLVEVELRANELRDSPVQRDGPLRGKTVVVDARVGTPLADVSGTVSTSITRDVGERTSAGGTISLNSQGSLVVEQGATLDVSGGAVRYTGGVIATSQVVRADGSMVDIGAADPDVRYRGVFTPTFRTMSRKWGVSRTVSAGGVGYYDPGYVQGSSAGTLVVAAPQMLVNGTLLGRATNGAYQRAAADRARGGRLVVGLADGQGLGQPDYRAPSVTFTRDIVAGSAPVDDQLWLATDYLDEGGFQDTEVYSNGRISVTADTPLALAGGSSLLLRGAAVDVGADITSAGGTVRLGSVLVNEAVSLAGGARPGVTVADGVTISTAGAWVNDTLALAGLEPTTPLWTSGGRVELAVTAPGGELVIGDGVRIAADAGAWLDAGGGLHAGGAGRIGILARGVDVALETGTGLALSAAGFRAGGSLSIAANQVTLGATDAGAQRSDPTVAGTSPYVLGPGFFTTGGFQSFEVIATGGRLGDAGAVVEPLTVAAGAEVAPRVALRFLDAGYQARATGADLSTFTRLVEPLPADRPAASLRLAVEPHGQVSPENSGNLLLAAGSRVALDPGGSLALAGPRQVVIDGAVSAPGGVIAATVVKPPSSLDQGFDADVGVVIGATARVSTAGVAVLEPNDAGLRTGEVLDGGAINLTALRGTIRIAAGAVLDVSGTAAELDLPAATTGGSAPYRPTTVASAGGSIALLAPEGITIDGQLLGAAGGSGATRPEGGSLAIGISRRRGWEDSNNPDTYPATPREIVIGGGPGEAADGTVRIDADALLAGGFDNLALQADDAIVFAKDTDLAVANRLELQAPVLRAADGVTTVGLAANSLAIGPRLLDSVAPGAATAGGAGLVARAGLVEFFGDSALQGFGTSRFESAGDLRFTGAVRTTPGPLTGSFSAAGQVVFTAAQVYPTTYTDFTVDVAPDAGGRLEIRGQGFTPETPLAGAGRLALRAGDILQAGVIRAPLGEVSLAATDSLVLAAGSTTSTSAAGLTIPFGKVIAGQAWYYESTTGSPQPVTGPGGRRIALEAADVTVAEGATVDLRGGGDLHAWEFVPGPGGSADALSPDVNPGLFAILPGSALPFAPFDTQSWSGTTLRPGDSVHLEAVPGLIAAGTYALLPARYALLPGAVLVEAVPGTSDLPAGTGARLADGAAVAAGYSTVAGTGLRDGRTSGFAVRPGSYARQFAEYEDYLASDFFAGAASAAVRLPRDAGDLRIVVGELLDLSGDLLAEAAEEGRGARVDISASRLAVVGPGAAPAEGVVQIRADALEGLGAASLLLGGTREYGSTLTTITPVATSVELAPGVALRGPETLLAATGNITLGAGARLGASGARADASGPLRLAGADGALVRVSTGGAVDFTRGATGGTTGDILLDTGAAIAAPGAILAAAAGTLRALGSIEGDGAAVSLGSRRIALGIAQGSADDTELRLSDAALAALGNAAELRLGAGESITFAGPVDLGGSGRPRPDRLVLDAPALLGTGGDATLAAGTVVIGNGGAAATAPAPGTGTLAVVADAIRFTDGDVTVGGFGRVALDAQSLVRAEGDTRLVVAADLDVETPLLAGASGSGLTIDATGHEVSLAGGGTADAAAAGLGAALDVSASGITADTRLLFPSGSIRLAATDTLALGAGARLDARGGARVVGPATVVTPGGVVTLVARTGDLVQAAGSVVDVSAGATTGTAGTVALYAGDALTLGGSLLGSGADAKRSGSVQAYAGSIGGFDALNAQLAAGGFHRAIQVETGSGNLAVGAGTVVDAQDVTLAASGGSLDVAGRIAGTGRVVLAARDDLTLAAGAVVQSAGGDILLASAAGDLAVTAGSTIDAAAAGGAEGTILLRAAATANDMRLTDLSGTLAGAREVVLEPVVAATAGPVVDAGAISGFRALLAGYMDEAGAAIRARLGLDPVRDVIRPGLELTATGDVTLSAEWDLRTWRYDGQPGTLTLRVPGQLNLNADLTDGFIRGGTVAAPTLTQTTGPSWSFRLAGGADADSALPWATAGRLIDGRGAGGVRLADNRAIRTGTGSILVAADTDVALAGRGSVIYTAGVAARDPAPIGIGGSRVTRNWVRDGGDITLLAGRDVTAVAPTQVMSGWNARSTTGAGAAEWAIDFTKFQQGVAAMAGGDVTVRAGRDIANLSAAVLTTSGELDGASQAWGGGDIAVSAGRDVLGGVFSTWSGDGTVTAGRDVRSGLRLSGTDVHTILSFGNGRFDVNARRDLRLEGVVNPTTVSPANASSVYFYSYTPGDALGLTATGGDLALVNNPNAFRAIVGSTVATNTVTFGVYPGTLTAAAASGSIEFVTAMRMLPSATGQVEFIAGDSITARSSGVALLMSDADPAGVPVAARPVSRDQVLASVSRYALEGIHAGDTTPVRLVAATGDIDGGTYSLAKHFEVFAGRDVRNVAVNGQNTDPRQVSVVRAGRDVALPDPANGISVGGPGRVAVLAGGDVDLGFSAGVTTLGRTVVAGLPGDRGADIDIWAGLAGDPDFAAFNARYWDEQYEAELAEYSAGLLPYVRDVTGDASLDSDSVWAAWGELTADQRAAYTATLEPAAQVNFESFAELVNTLVAYVELVTGQAGVAPSAANDAYLGLAAEAQRPMVDQFFFRELRDSGREANLGSDPDFAGGRDAAATLFPGAVDWAGDVSLLFSRIYTLDGGDINIMAPGGILNVGLATVPATVTVQKKPSDLGIVAQGPGAVRIFTDGDVLVNQSRVFTLEGGDIVIWSANGDIDAGRGSKSAISAPPPTITVSPTGAIEVTFSDAIAGSGIRGILVRDDIEPGDVDLVAPTGEVNAGDAGIGSAGNLNIAAPQVVGLDNIQVGGVSTGVPAEAGGLAASLTGVSNVASSATDTAEASAGDAAAAAQTPLADAALGWLEVFVTGFGDGEEDEDERRRKAR